MQHAILGAPEVIKKLLKEGSCPNDYDRVSMSHMGMGQRVLAMAYRKISNTREMPTLKKIKREDVESDLIFAGFLLLDCPIKGDSKVSASFSPNKYLLLLKTNSCTVCDTRIAIFWAPNKDDYWR